MKESREGGRGEGGREGEEEWKKKERGDRDRMVGRREG